MNGGTALGTWPSRLDRLVVVGESPDAPGWVQDWCNRTRLGPRIYRIPATTPGHRPIVGELLDTVIPLAVDPVLVLHPDSTDTDLRQVTAALHDLPDDAPVLAAAVEAARQLGAPLVVTHGLPVSFAERNVGLASAQEHGRRLLDAAARRIGAEAPGLAVVTRLVRAHPHELVGKELDTGLLVVGGPRDRVHDDLGLVARTALNHATCPVLIVPR
jgi:nucleotide-binding universal stress UspA family protein